MSKDGKWWLISEKDLLNIRKYLEDLQVSIANRSVSKSHKANLSDSIRILNSGLYGTSEVPWDYRNRELHCQCCLSIRVCAVYEVMQRFYTTNIEFYFLFARHCSSFLLNPQMKGGI